MVLSRDRKEKLLEDLQVLFTDSAASIASNYSGLTGDEITQLRKDLKSKGIRLMVTKNSLVRKALVEAKLEVDEEILDQPVIFAFGEDEVEVCKNLNEYAKSHEKLKILGGIVRSEKVDEAKIKVLALLPGRDELQAKLVGVIAGPLNGFVNVLAGNMRGLVNVLNQYQEKIK